MSSFVITPGTAPEISGANTTDKKGFGTVEIAQTSAFGSTTDVSVTQMFAQETYDTASLVVSGRIVYIDIGGGIF